MRAAADDLSFNSGGGFSGRGRRRFIEILLVFAYFVCGINASVKELADGAAGHYAEVFAYAPAQNPSAGWGM